MYFLCVSHYSCFDYIMFQFVQFNLHERVCNEPPQLCCLPHHTTLIKYCSSHIKNLDLNHAYITQAKFCMYAKNDLHGFA